MDYVIKFCSFIWGQERCTDQMNDKSECKTKTFPLDTDLRKKRLRQSFIFRNCINTAHNILLISLE